MHETATNVLASTIRENYTAKTLCNGEKAGTEGRETRCGIDYFQKLTCYGMSRTDVRKGKCNTGAGINAQNKQQKTFCHHP